MKRKATIADFYEAIPYVQDKYAAVLEIVGSMKKELFVPIAWSGSVYPALARWEREGHVVSRWREGTETYNSDGSIRSRRREYAKEPTAPRVLETLVEEDGVIGELVPEHI